MHTSLSSVSSERLIAMLHTEQSGAAMRELHARYSGYVLKIATRMLHRRYHGPIDPTDIAQTVWLAVWKRYSKPQAQVKGAAALIRRYTVNAVLQARQTVVSRYTGKPTRMMMPLLQRVERRDGGTTWFAVDGETEIDVPLELISTPPASPHDEQAPVDDERDQATIDESLALLRPQQRTFVEAVLAGASADDAKRAAGYTSTAYQALLMNVRALNRIRLRDERKSWSAPIPAALIHRVKN